MRRRGFIAGLLGTTAAVALPLPKIAAAPVVQTWTSLESDRMIGIALNTAGPGEVVRVMLNATQSIFLTARDQTYAGGMITDDAVAEWTQNTPEQILADIEAMQSVLRENEDVFSVSQLFLDGVLRPQPLTITVRPDPPVLKDIS